MVRFNSQQKKLKTDTGIALRPVEKKVEKLGRGGVRFNVETVERARSPPAALDAKRLNRSVHQAITSFNAKEDAPWDSRSPTTKAVIEASSLSKTEGSADHICHFGQGLVGCAMTAFAHHHPLILSPDDIWGPIAYAFAKHVEGNAEALRDKFVKHQGQKVLCVDVDHFRVGEMPPEAWESDVFPGFSRQIRDHIGEDTHSMIAGAFSTTTATEQVANEITLMAAMKKYFSYKMRTRCGIPYIQLEGNVDDWKTLRTRAEALKDKMMPEFGDKWLPLLLPVLEKIVESADGNVDPLFWQSMVKRVQHGAGSGSYSTVSGWISLLFPYLKDGGQSRHLKPWTEMWSSDGPEPDDFPNMLSSAPVQWEYFGETLKMHFHAGLIGGKVDPETGALRPMTVWMVTHDPPTEPAKILPILKKELEELTKYQKGDPNDFHTNYEIRRLQKEIQQVQNEIA